MLQGPYCFDVDGNKYIDYIGSWGPAIVGAANDEVNAALHTQIDKGTSFGAPCELEVSPWPGRACKGQQPRVNDTHIALPAPQSAWHCSQGLSAQSAQGATRRQAVGSRLLGRVSCVTLLCCGCRTQWRRR